MNIIEHITHAEKDDNETQIWWLESLSGELKFKVRIRSSKILQHVDGSIDLIEGESERCFEHVWFPYGTPFEKVFEILTKLTDWRLDRAVEVQRALH